MFPFSFPFLFLRRVIGATTRMEYRKYIEKDMAFARRFIVVEMKEPSVERTVIMLQGLRPRLENHHRIKISDEALVAAAQLSHRYIKNRQLPDKAIDLVGLIRPRRRVRPQLFSALALMVPRGLVYTCSALHIDTIHSLHALHRLRVPILPSFPPASGTLSCFLSTAHVLL